jgi:hypothetical protein
MDSDEIIQDLKDENSDLKYQIFLLQTETDRTPHAMVFYSVLCDKNYIPTMQQLSLQLNQLKKFITSSEHIDFITLRRRLQVCLTTLPVIDRFVNKYEVLYKQWIQHRLKIFSTRNLTGGSADSTLFCPICHISSQDVSPTPQRVTPTITNRVNTSHGKIQQHHGIQFHGNFHTNIPRPVSGAISSSVQRIHQTSHFQNETEYQPVDIDDNNRASDMPNNVDIISDSVTTVDPLHHISEGSLLSAKDSMNDSFMDTVKDNSSLELSPVNLGHSTSTPSIESIRGHLYGDNIRDIDTQKKSIEDVNVSAATSILFGQDIHNNYSNYDNYLTTPNDMSVEFPNIPPQHLNEYSSHNIQYLTADRGRSKSINGINTSKSANNMDVSRRSIHLDVMMPVTENIPLSPGSSLENQ